MKFGIMFDTHVDKWDLIRYAEELGYDAAWVPDSQMLWSDCYATMALAAVNTQRIRIGTGGIERYEGGKHCRRPVSAVLRIEATGLSNECDDALDHTTVLRDHAVA